VQSSRLITGKKSKELIQKISKLTSTDQAKQLNRQVHIHGRAKMLNESVYYSIDAIHAAINDKKKISFKYFDYNTKKKQIYRRSDKPYVRTPIAMCWNEDKYYLLTFNPHFSDPFATYRVDRMAGVEVLEEAADKYDRKSFSVAEYIRKTFGMYAGETVTATLSFHESLVSVVLDQFGSDIRMTDIGGERFTVNAEVSNSPVFLGWIFQLGDKAEIIEPESLRVAMRDMLATGNGMYGEHA
jgi:predicted DNA-binding transcriptional regulator YafY